MFVSLGEIPYLEQFPNDGRLVTLMNFFDGQKFHVYIPQADGRILRMIPLEMSSGLYLAASPASPLDIEVPFLTFLFQYSPIKRAFSTFNKVSDDFENALSVIDKLEIIEDYFGKATTGDLRYSSMVSTDLEYSLINYRSAYDLVNELIGFFLRELSVINCQLPNSFADTIGKPDMVEKYTLPQPIAAFYNSKKERFLLMRDLRDSIAHHGHSPGLIFKLDEGFAISGTSGVGRRLREEGVWNSLHPNEQDLVSCRVFLAMLADDLNRLVADATVALESSSSCLPRKAAPGYAVFSRSPFAETRQRLSRLLEQSQ